MKFAVAALLAKTISAASEPATPPTPAVPAGISEADVTKCTAQVVEYERLGWGASLKTEVEWTGKGLGGPDLMAIEKSKCMTDAAAAWEAIKVAAFKEADFAACKAKLDSGDQKAAA